MTESMAKGTRVTYCSLKDEGRGEEALQGCACCLVCSAPEACVGLLVRQVSFACRIVLETGDAFAKANL